MRRASARGFTAIELAVAVAVVGSILAVALPAFIKELHASRFSEAVDGLARAGRGTVEHAEAQAAAGRTDVFPASAPLTPANVPRGRYEVDPPAVWEHPTWLAIGFRAAPEGVPHAFAFAFDGPAAAGEAQFAVRARGDIDADGVLSIFEIKGIRDTSGTHVLPGMYVDAELE